VIRNLGDRRQTRLRFHSTALEAVTGRSSNDENDHTGYYAPNNCSDVGTTNVIVSSLRIKERWDVGTYPVESEANTGGLLEDGGDIASDLIFN
jgi:hypothetical protein